MMRITIAAAVLPLLPVPAAAQDRLTTRVEVATDEARRGLSWSEGRIAPSASIGGNVAGIEAEGRFTATRASDRHGGADAVFDLRIGHGFDVGAIRLSADATAHLFSGATGSLDYVELGVRASYLIGPLQIEAGADYAPDQNAIGGDNLYLFADAVAGIPATPLTVRAGVGRSSGGVEDPIRAARLRPSGRYHDWRIGVEHVTGPLVLAVDYVGTDVRRAAAVGPLADARHAGDRVVGRVGLAF